MSSRVFCDNCGGEMHGDSENVVKTAIESTKGGVMFRITAGFNAMHTGEVCATCVYEAIARKSATVIRREE